MEFRLLSWFDLVAAASTVSRIALIITTIYIICCALVEEAQYILPRYEIKMGNG